MNGYETEFIESEEFKQKLEEFMERKVTQSAILAVERKLHASRKGAQSVLVPIRAAEELVRAARKGVHL